MNRPTLPTANAPYENIIHPDDLPRINAEIASHGAGPRPL